MPPRRTTIKTDNSKTTTDVEEVAEPQPRDHDGNDPNFNFAISPDVRSSFLQEY